MREGSAIWTEDTRVRDEGFVGVVGDDSEAREDVDCEGETGDGREVVDREKVISFQLFSKSRPWRAKIGRDKDEGETDDGLHAYHHRRKSPEGSFSHERDGRR